MTYTKSKKDIEANIEYLTLAPERGYMTSHDAALALLQIAAKVVDVDASLAFMAMEGSDEILRAPLVTAADLVRVC